MLQEIAPTTKMIENAPRNALKDLITKGSEYLRNAIITSSPVSDIAKFYWSVIASCCKRIQVGEKDFKKLDQFSFTIEKLGRIYVAYCEKNADVLQPISEVPKEIKLMYMREYFIWIMQMQSVFKYWHELFAQQMYNYDDILNYASILPIIEKLAQSLNIADLIYEIDYINELKVQYHELYNKLSNLIVKRNKDPER